MKIWQFLPWYQVVEWWTRGQTDVVCIQGVLFWGAFAKLRKATISFVMSVCPHGASGIFMKFVILRFFRKSFEKMYVSLKSNKSNGYLTWGLVLHSFDNIVLNSSQYENFQTKFVEKLKKKSFMLNNSFPRKSCHLWDNVGKHGRRCYVPLRLRKECVKMNTLA